MSSPAIRPRNHQPAAGPGGAKGPAQTLRVLSEEGATPAAAPSIAMPRAKTELSELLAGDKSLCVRRRPPATATRGNADSESDAYGANSATQAETPAAGSGPWGGDSSPPTHPADADLGRVVNAWPRLPRNVRAAVLAIIRETAARDTL